MMKLCIYAIYMQYIAILHIAHGLLLRSSHCSQLCRPRDDVVHFITLHIVDFRGLHVSISQTKGDEVVQCIWQHCTALQTKGGEVVHFTTLHIAHCWLRHSVEFLTLQPAGSTKGGEVVHFTALHIAALHIAHCWLHHSVEFLTLQPAGPTKARGVKLCQERALGEKQ